MDNWQKDFFLTPNFIKQRASPKGNSFFSLLFSLSKNPVHNEVQCCAEIQLTTGLCNIQKLCCLFFSPVSMRYNCIPLAGIGRIRYSHYYFSRHGNSVSVSRILQLVYWKLVLSYFLPLFPRSLSPNNLHILPSKEENWSSGRVNEK